MPCPECDFRGIETIMEYCRKLHSMYCPVCDETWCMEPLMKCYKNGATHLRTKLLLGKE